LDKTLQKYLLAFSKLNQGRTPYGSAPHKPILLLSLLQAFEQKIIQDNFIAVSPELLQLFKLNWNRLVKTPHVCNFALPFFHLKNEKTNVWMLIPKHGFEASLSVKHSLSSLGELTQMTEGATLPDDLFYLINSHKDNKILQACIIQKYFPDAEKEAWEGRTNQEGLFAEIEDKLLNESPEQYKKEMEELLKNKEEEEIYLRGSLFKREIPKLYQQTCCISGMRIDSQIAVSMIDACHIVPFSVSHDDTVSNGIALCPNLHRAFDRGLISIDNDYTVKISSLFREEENPYSIRLLEKKKILLPLNKKYYPSVNNLEWHRSNVFKY